MKKEKQIGGRGGLPVFFALETEDVYKHTQGAHRALSYPDFLGLLIGLGLEEYRRTYGIKPEAPEIKEEQPEEESLFSVSRNGLKDMFEEFDRAMEPDHPPGLRLIRPEAEDMEA